MIEFLSKSVQQTFDFGARLGSLLHGGEVIAITGQLGAGKTHFVKGLCIGLGADDSSGVNSPTFVLVNEYFSESKGLEIYHIDAYRIESTDEFEMLGFDEMCHPQSVVLIEWADKLGQILKDIDAVGVRMEHAGENQRKIFISNLPEDILSALKQSFISPE